MNLKKLFSRFTHKKLKLHLYIYLYIQIKFTMASSSELPSEMILSTILEYTSTNSKDMTYIGIGTCPHNDDIDKLPEKERTLWDQVIPVFMTDIINETRKSIRMIHFDPQYSIKIPIMMEYFSKRGYKYDNTIGFHRWVTDDNRIEILIFEINFEHHRGVVAEQFRHLPHNNIPPDDWFLDMITEQTILQGGQLILQEFTGWETNDLFKKIFDKTPNKELFKKKILFDVSYGNASCMLDLNKYKPFYDKNGDFLNFILYTREEILQIIGIHSGMDELIKIYFLKEYRDILNNHQVNYRRKLKGDTLLFPNKYYNESTTPDEIMTVLQKLLSERYDIFRKMKLISAEKELEIVNLFQNYHTIDPYRWHELVNKIVL